MYPFPSIQIQPSLKERLIESIKAQKIPHAQIFWGPSGGGNLTLAVAFSTYLKCHQPSAADACGTCPACLSAHKLCHPDTHYLFPTTSTKSTTDRAAISNQHRAAWRTFVQEQPYGSLEAWANHLGTAVQQMSISKESVRQLMAAINLKAFEGSHKVAIIWQPERLHPVAANALLKVLEEPPPHTYFLLVAHRLEDILPTIRSRACQVYMPDLSDSEVAPMSSQEDASEMYEPFANWLRACYTKNFLQLTTQAMDFQQLAREAQTTFVRYALHMLREALVAQATVQSSLTKGTPAEQALASKLSKTFAYGQLKAASLYSHQAYADLARHVQAKLLYLDLSLKLVNVLKKG